MTTSRSFTALWQRFFIIAGNIFFFIIFFLLLTTKEQDFRNTSNLKLFAGSLPITLFLYALFFFLSRKKASPLLPAAAVPKHPLLAPVMGYLLLFLLLCVCIHFTYFYTGWDVGLIRVRLEGLLAGQTAQETGVDVGYSIYPNNLLLFYLQYLTVKAGAVFFPEHPYNLCLYSSCLCVTLACFLGSLTIRQISRNRLIRLIYTLISTLYILCSPWVMIPYSDTYGMLFVALGIWALFCARKPAVKWPVFAFASLIGCRIKPTCIFLLFAAVILYLPSLPALFRAKRRELCIFLLSCLIFFIIGQGISPWIQHRLDFTLDPERKVPPTHYIMMGLNTGSKGGFDGSDYVFTTSLPTYEEKVRRTLRESKLRWLETTPAQKRDHYMAKFLYTYNDGTFSWTKEGGFFDVMPEHDNPLNDLYLQIVKPEGKYFTAYCNFAQIIWLQILLGIPFLFLRRERQTSRKAFLTIVLCGLTVFLMLFEARARYLFLYSPAFLILSLYGYDGLFSFLSKNGEPERQKQPDVP